MRDIRRTIKLNGEDYPVVFNLNVLDEIQQEYGSFEAWGELSDANADGMNMKAVKFGLCAMINEAIDIENEETGARRPFVSGKWLGRVLDVDALAEAAQSMNALVVESAADPDDENGKNA